MKIQRALFWLLVLMIIYLCSCTPKVETTMTENDSSADSHITTETPFEEDDSDTDSFTRHGTIPLLMD